MLRIFSYQHHIIRGRENDILTDANVNYRPTNKTKELYSLVPDSTFRIDAASGLDIGTINMMNSGKIEHCLIKDDISSVYDLT